MWAMPAVTDDITAILTTYLARMHGILDRLSVGDQRRVPLAEN